MQPPRVEIRFPATRGGFAQGFASLRRTLDAEPLGAASRYHAELVFEEIAANIVNHGTRGGRELEVCVTVEARPEAIVLTFEDAGVPFDPCAQREAAPPRSLEDERIGGFGLMLVRRVTTALEYQRTANGRNRLTARVSRGEPLPARSGEHADD
jgi:anti-sigma regulatory factor (Ser/Thr protein kinase)